MFLDGITDNNFAVGMNSQRWLGSHNRGAGAMLRVDVHSPMVLSNKGASSPC